MLRDSKAYSLEISRDVRICSSIAQAERGIKKEDSREDATSDGELTRCSMNC